MNWMGVLIAFFILILTVIYFFIHPAPVYPDYLASPVYNGDKWKELVTDVFTEAASGSAKFVKETDDISASN